MCRRFYLLLLGAVLGLSLMPPSCPGRGAAARDYQVEVWDTDSGLPHSTVTSMAQTPDGYLWVGTLNGGLARFDGARFVNFHPGNTPELQSIEVQNLLVDSQGTLWVGLVEGTLVSYRDGRFHLERQNPQTPQSWLGALVSSRTNEVVLASIAGWLYRGTRVGGTNRWETSQPPESDMLSSPCADRAGVIWYRTADARLGRFQDNKFSRLSDPPGLRSPQINTLTTDATGRLWVGTEKELAAWDGTAFVNMTPTNGVPELAVRQIVAGCDGSLWVRTEEKLQKCAGRSWVVTLDPWNGPFPTSGRPMSLLAESHGGVWVAYYGAGVWHVGSDGLVSHVSEKEGLPSGVIGCGIEDREGNVWVGLTGGGLACVRPQVFHTVWPLAGLHSRIARSVCEDRDGTMWFGTAGESVLRWRRGEFATFTPPAQSTVGMEINVCPDSQGQLWVGSVQNGVMVFAGEEFHRPFPSADIGTVARVLYTDRAGALWIGSEFGLFRWDQGKLHPFTAAEGFTSAYVLAITEDKSGNLWVGTAVGELRRFKDGRFETFRPQPPLTSGALTQAAADSGSLRSQGRGALSGGERFWALHADEQGVIWIGTLGGGLLRFKAGEFTRYTPREGLPSEHVSQILEDERGQLWLGTRCGIARASRDALNEFAEGKRRSVQFVTYGKSDGLPALECSGGSQPACWRSRDGRLWFTTVKGAVCVDPRDLPHNTLPPPVVLEEISVDSRPLAAEGQPPRRHVPAGRHYFEFKFTALSFNSPDKVRFQWRLAGLEKDWVAGGNRRAASYSFIPPGDYQFQVQACNNDGVWNETGATGSLTVLPYFWQTWWFKAGSGGTGLLLILGTVLSVQRRRHHARMRVLERQHALERERTRIARDIHDQVGANLTKIGKLTESLERHAAVAEPYQPVLRTLADTTREIVRTMDEIVWAVNPRNDTLDNAVNYLVHYAEEFLGHSGVGCELDVPVVIPPMPVSAEARHNLFMAVREALNNAVKHGRPACVRLRLAAHATGLSVSLEDDGCGFTPVGKPTGRNGLENMRKRIESVGGQFQLDSAPGRGTRVRLVVPAREP